MKFTWLQRSAVLETHAVQIEQHGGLPGIRDEGALKAALGRPPNGAADGEPNAFELAAAYAYGIARDRPFADGNKRTAFVSSALFLERHEFTIEASSEEIVSTFCALAAGDLTEEALADWFRSVTVAPGG